MTDYSRVTIGEQRCEDFAPAEGYHNSKPQESRERIINGASYRDCSTVCLTPTPASGFLHYKVADSQANILRPMNQKYAPMRITGMEVADAYNTGLSTIFDSPDLAKWKFVLTWEHDNVAPPDGLIRLAKTMYGGPWAAVGGLYWTKGEDGQPMIYGDPRDPEIGWRPQPPEPEAVQECRGVGMGFTLWDLKLFKDKRLGPPWFRTVQDWNPYEGAKAGTQDLEFCKRAGELGYRFAVDTSVRVGHVQLEATPTHPAGFVW